MSVDDFALSSYREFRVVTDDTMKSILSSCNVRMKPFAIRELTSADEMDFTHMGDEETLIAAFASMSDTDSNFDFLFSLLMDTVMSALCKAALEGHGDSPSRPVHFVFDEFANIGHTPDFERIITVTRSRNIAVSMVLQSLSQLKPVYGDNNAETIVNACDTLLYLGGKSNETNKQICDMVGKQTVANITATDSRGANWSRTVSYGLVERDLIQLVEVACMPCNKALVLLNGQMLLLDRKYDLDKPLRASAHGAERICKSAAALAPSAAACDCACPRNAQGEICGYGVGLMSGQMVFWDRQARARMGYEVLRTTRDAPGRLHSMVAKQT